MWVSTDIDYVVSPSDKYILDIDIPGHRSERRARAMTGGKITDDVE